MQQASSAIWKKRLELEKAREAKEREQTKQNIKFRRQKLDLWRIEIERAGKRTQKLQTQIDSMELNLKKLVDHLLPK